MSPPAWTTTSDVIFKGPRRDYYAWCADRCASGDIVLSFGVPCPEAGLYFAVREADADILVDHAADLQGRLVATFPERGRARALWLVSVKALGAKMWNVGEHDQLSVWLSGSKTAPAKVRRFLTLLREGK